VESPVKKLRAALGWSQADLAQSIGRSYQSVRDYERGIRPSAEVIDKLKTLAAKHGLTFDPFPSDQPGPAPTLLSSRRPASRNPSSARNDQAHALLDEVLASGDKDAISAVLQNLDAFTRLTRLSHPQRRAPKKA
jgi:transcriptional regulator with XRE-family HTH domain